MENGTTPVTSTCSSALENCILPRTLTPELLLKAIKAHISLLGTLNPRLHRCQARLSGSLLLTKRPLRIVKPPMGALTPQIMQTIFERENESQTYGRASSHATAWDIYSTCAHYTARRQEGSFWSNTGDSFFLWGLSRDSELKVGAKNAYERLEKAFEENKNQDYKLLDVSEELTKAEKLLSGMRIALNEVVLERVGSRKELKNWTLTKTAASSRMVNNTTKDNLCGGGIIWRRLNWWELGEWGTLTARRGKEKVCKQWFQVWRTDAQTRRGH